MSKFASALDTLLNVKVYAEDMINLTHADRTTLRHARRGDTKIRRSTAVLFLAGARKIVERKKRELNAALAELEKAYAEEFKTRTEVNTNAQV